jgi:PAS domain S-box-containing protein
MNEQLQQTMNTTNEDTNWLIPSKQPTIHDIHRIQEHQKRNAQQLKKWMEQLQKEQDQEKQHEQSTETNETTQIYKQKQLLPPEYENTEMNEYYDNTTNETFETNKTNKNNTTNEHSSYFDLSNQMLATVDFNGSFVTLNSQWSLVLGYSISQLKKIPLLSLVHSDDFDITQQCISKLVNELRVHFHSRLRCNNGVYVHVNWSVSMNVEKKVLCVAAETVTQQVKQYQKYHRSINKLLVVNFFLLILFYHLFCFVFLYSLAYPIQ